MLQLIIIGVLLGVIGILGVVIEVQRGKLKRARDEIESWKLACASLRDQLSSW